MDIETRQKLEDIIKYQRAQLGLLSEIKFELQNARKMNEVKEKEEKK